MAKLLENKVAIVTGAARGIGREHALSLARHGASVVVTTRRRTRTAPAAMPRQHSRWSTRSLPQAVRPSPTATTWPIWDGAKRMVDTAIETFGGLNAVVNNAGILRDRMLANMTEAEWDAVINVH